MARALPLISILGPTASGKTRLAVELAIQLDGEILSADSRQVYRGMDIGTGKDLDDYSPPNGSVPYHLIDILDAGQRYNLYDFQRDFYQAHAQIVARGRQPIMCGGSGMYAEAILRAYQLHEVPPDPDLRAQLEPLTHDQLVERLRAFGTLHNTTDTTSRARLIRAIEIARGSQAGARERTPSPGVEIGPIFAVDLTREDRRARISQRLTLRLQQGLVEEVRGLLEAGVPQETLRYYGLEYRFVTEHIMGETSYDEMVRRLEIAIHQFAKRQMTYLRGMQTRGINLVWVRDLDDILRVLTSTPRG